MKQSVSFVLNEKKTEIVTDPDRKLLWILRTDLGLTGTKYGCGGGYCGACTVLVNGEAVRSCQTSVGELSGKKVATIEGLEKNGILSPLQNAFVIHDALQCGYCTSGMIMSASALLNSNAHPSRADIIDWLDANLCRCGAHLRIVSAVQAAAESKKGAM